MSTRFTAVAAVGSAAALLLTAMPVTARAEDPAPQADIAAAAQYIADSFGGTGNASDSMIALAAADTQPVKLAEMGTALATFSAGQTSPNAATRGKLMIAADAANLDARFFAKADCSVNWATALRADADANQLGAYWAPQLTAIALARLGEPVPTVAFEKILASQGDNGAWGFGTGDRFTPQPDDTAMSIYALGLIVDSEVEAVETREAALDAIFDALDWAHSDDAVQELDGNYYWTTYSPANSTGLMASALAEIGEDVSSPQAFLAAQQLPGSGWSNTLNGTSVNLMATNQAILGAAGAGYATARATGTVTHTCAQPPAITTQPADVDAPPSTSALTAVVTDADELQWQYYSEDGWVDVEGATSATLTTTVEGEYRLTATNAQGSSFSRVATLFLTDEPTPTPTPSVKPTAKPTTPAPAPFDLYTTPGVHHVNGRIWATSCEPYSKTRRCRTDIWATTVAKENGAYVRTTGWAFNNLTYVASPRSLWTGNPLAETGEWTAKDGRQWSTDCDSAATGRGGCRNFAKATVVSAVPQAAGGYTFKQSDVWLLNSMIRFS